MNGKHGGSVPNPNGINMMEGGFARISVGRQTHTWLKQVARGESLSKTVRRLVLQELGETPPALTGHGSEVSAATIRAVAAQNADMVMQITAIREDYNVLELLICDIARAVGIKKIDTGLREKARALKRSIVGNESQQGELNLVNGR